MIRLVRFLHRHPELTPEEFDVYRRDVHGPLVAGLQSKLALVRYVQTHRSVAAGSYKDNFIGRRPGTCEQFDGLDEFWWQNAMDCAKALSGEFCGVLQESDLNYLTSDGTAGWLAVEYPQVAAGVGALVAAPKSGILKVAFVLAPGPGLDESSACLYWLNSHGPLIRRYARARGTLAYNQVHRFRGELEEPLRGLGANCDTPFMGHAEAWFSETGWGGGYDAEEAAAAAVADEREFIDWTKSSVLIGKELVFVDRLWA